MSLECLPHCNNLKNIFTSKCIYHKNFVKQLTNLKRIYCEDDIYLLKSNSHKSDKNNSVEDIYLTQNQVYISQKNAQYLIDCSNNNISSTGRNT